MQIQVVKSKIHRVSVTGADLNYIGSITIDEALLEASNIIEGEKVAIVNVNNGERLETYAIKGPRNTGEITLNGPAARKVHRGDIIIIIRWSWACPIPGGRSPHKNEAIRIRLFQFIFRVIHSFCFFFSMKQPRAECHHRANALVARDDDD